MPEVINEPALVKVEAPVTSFESFLDDAIGGMQFDNEPAAPVVQPAAASATAKPAEPVAVPAKPAEPVAVPAKPAEPAAAAPAPGLTVPDSVTNKAAGVVPDLNLPDPKLAAREAELLELLKSKPGQAFAGIKSDLEAERKLRAEETTKLRAELEAAKKAPVALPEEIARVQKEADEIKAINADYEKELALVKVEATREYKASVSVRYAEIDSAVKDLSGKHKVSEALLNGVIREADPTKQDAALAELAAPMPERDRIKLYGLVEKFQAVSAQDQFVRKNAQQALAMIEERRSKDVNARREAVTKEYADGLDQAWTGLRKDNPFLNPIEGQTEWNKTLEELNATARKIDVEKLTPTQRAHLVYQGVATPIMASVVQYYAQEVVKLRAELAARGKVLPGAGGGNPGDVRQDAANEGMGFLEAMETNLR